MRSVAVFLLAAGLVLAGASPASAAPPSRDPHTAAQYAAAWLAHQVNGAGFLPQAANPAAANLSLSAQAVPALASAGVGKTQVDALLAYLGQHVNDFVAPAGSDDPAALGYLILAAEAGGEDPTAFGTSVTNLVTRLVATQQPNGLFGTADPTFDGAFREGIALLALHAAGVGNANGVAWLTDQQCADGLWTAFRADTTQPCPPVDPNTFTGPDTNSSALAALGAGAQGATALANDGVAALKAVRSAMGGGWGFLADAGQATDANSTGAVLEAIRTVTGAADVDGVNALLELQVGCTAAAADRGGIAFQPGPNGALAPDGLATAQATAALAEVALPVVTPAIGSDLPAPCRSTAVTTAGTTPVSAQGAPTTVAPSGSSAVAAEELPRTGTASGALALSAACMVAAGCACVAGSRRRRR